MFQPSGSINTLPEHGQQLDKCYVTHNMPLFNLVSTSWHYFVFPAHKLYQYSLKIASWGLKRLGVFSVDKVVFTYIGALVGFVCKVVSSLHGNGQDKDLKYVKTCSSTQ
jgi:hypothetical protein